MRAKLVTYKRARRLRREMTLPEVILWDALRRDRLGVGFRRQYPKGDYILDFYCPSARLAIEVDGEDHGRDEQARRDVVRDAWLNGSGITVMRIPASVVLDREGLLGAVTDIAAAIDLKTAKER